MIRHLKAAIIAFAFAFAGQASGAESPGISVQKSLICHGKIDFKKVDETGKLKYLYVNDEDLRKSVHQKKGCTDCHADVNEIPHKTTPKQVNCARCHFKGNPEGAPQSDKYLEYQESSHGKAWAAGKKNAPGCQDCHGTHDVRHKADPLSHVTRANLARTCGRCHLEPYNQYMESVHGDAAYVKGVAEAPTCSDCHGEHNIIEHLNPQSSVYATNVSKKCSHCHGEEKIVGKYGIDAEQVKTFERSFHGIAIKYGDKTVANCASCHGIHNIRKKDDPKSSVYIENIPKTCGQQGCHPGANVNFAKGKIHVNPEKQEAGIIFWVAFAFKWLTILTMLALIIHILLDLYRRSAEYREKMKR